MDKAQNPSNTYVPAGNRILPVRPDVSILTELATSAVRSATLSECNDFTPISQVQIKFQVLKISLLSRMLQVAYPNIIYVT
jgi:hypothetical protein